MSAVAIRGATGTLRYGYLSAATVEKWRVAKATDGAFSLTATLGNHDVFRLTQRPLVFVVSVNGGALTWPVETLQVTGQALTATLGPMVKP